ncbi:MAG: orotidine-5'-phosphate decarboxylase [Coriobacteriales bacterium]|jgi:orotidine-5'-phosphate decarboxylase|nr:orotidine-5'-phosphate decarboxylase [Coriobacteriales bacterium]
MNAGINAAAEKIIVALDCSPEQARLLAAQLAGHASWLKVGMTLFYAAGPQIVREFKERGFKVFVDLKLHDIPHQVRGAAHSVVLAGADMLTVHAIGGCAMMEAAAQGIKEAGELMPALTKRPISLAITVLTSMDAAALAAGGVTRSLSEQVAALALQAQRAGLDGVVASPQEAAQLRELLGPQAAIVTPGVRPTGASVHDQSRVSTPAAALAAGASHLVIGRPITEADDPAAAFDAIAQELA